MLSNTSKISLGRDFSMTTVEVESIVAGTTKRKAKIDAFCCSTCCWYRKTKGGRELVWIERTGKRKWIYASANASARPSHIAVSSIYNSFNKASSDNYAEYVIQDFHMTHKAIKRKWEDKLFATNTGATLPTLLSAFKDFCPFPLENKRRWDSTWRIIVYVLLKQPLKMWLGEYVSKVMFRKRQDNRGKEKVPLLSYWGTLYIG